MSGVSGDFPVHPCHAVTRLVGLRSAAVQCSPFVRVSCRSPNSTSPTRTTCCGHVSDTPDYLDMSRWSESRYHPRSILVTFATRMLRGNCSRGI